MDRTELLRELSEAFGISGYEDNVVEILKKHFGKRVAISRDRIGSVIARKEGTNPRPKIMFSAHMDEIGFMVKEITKEGFIKFLPIGGWWAGNVPGLKVMVKTSKGADIPGVVGLKPIHELTPEERKKLPEIKDMYIDVGGAKDYNPKDKLGIRPGDPIIPQSGFERLANRNLLLGKAWDDRVGCALLINLLDNIEGIEHPNTVYLVGSVQEEVGLRGARTSAYTIEPDIGFALDVSICRDTPGNEGDAVERLGGGAGILIHDSTMIPHVKLREFVCELAEANKIPYHFTSIKGGYDTGTIHLTKFGVPCLALGVPTRYVHSGSSVISLEDYDNILKLITLIVKSLNKDVLEKLLG
ncbi:MAG: M42 family metallopeptidase [bacterium]